MNFDEFCVFQVYYHVPLWRTVREVAVYSLVEFLCDIGSMLCLMLGVSVLSLCECFEWIIIKLFQLRRQSNP